MRRYIPKEKIKRRRKFTDGELLKWYNKGLSDYKIAKIFKCHFSTIRLRRVKLGLVANFTNLIGERLDKDGLIIAKKVILKNQRERENKNYKTSQEYVKKRKGISKKYNDKNKKWITKRKKDYNKEQEVKIKRRKREEKYRKKPEFKEKQKIYFKKYYKKNKLKLREKDKKYYKKNREKLKTKAKDYRLKQKKSLTKKCKNCGEITGNSSQFCFSCHGKRREKNDK